MSIVNAAELAEIIGKEPRTITRWQDEGLPVKRRGKRGESNKYDTAAVIEWMIGREAEKADEGSAKGRLERIRAAREELCLYRDAAKLVAVDTVRQVLDRWVETAMNVMDGLEEKYAMHIPQVASDDAALREVLRALVREIREAIADIDLTAAFAGTDGGGSSVQLEIGSDDAREVSPAA